jgi:hypothetical protein
LLQKMRPVSRSTRTNASPTELVFDDSLSLHGCVKAEVPTKHPGQACGPSIRTRPQCAPLSSVRTSAHSQSAAENQTEPDGATRIPVSPV